MQGHDALQQTQAMSLLWRGTKSTQMKALQALPQRCLQYSRRSGKY